MSNAAFRSWLIGGWMAAAAIAVAVCVAMGAPLSITVFLVVAGIAPVVISRMLSSGAPTPTVADILHPADTAKK